MRWMKRTGIFKSIFLKFTFAFIAAGLIPLLFFSYISLDRFSNNIERFTISNFQQAIMYAGQSLEKIISDYDNITKIMYSYNAADSGDLTNILKSAAPVIAGDNRVLMKKYKLLDDFTRSVLYTDQHIQNVFFIDVNTKNVYFNSKDIKLLDYDYDFTQIEPYSRIMENKNTLTILPTHREEYFVRSNSHVITFARNYLDMSATPAENVVGTLLLDVDPGILDRLFSPMEFGDKSGIYVVDDQGYCIYSKDKEFLSKQMGWYTEKKSDFQAGGSAGYLSLPDSYWIFQKVEKSSWTVICQIYRRDVLKRVDDIRNFVSFIIIICITALILVAVAFSKGFTLPVKRMIHQMKKVESGNLDVRVEVTSADEVGQLAQGFNNMIYELKEYIDKAYVSQIKQREAELTALKTQIRPHFLYNTLEVIRMSAVENEDEKVADMIHSLSAQLKYVIGYNNDRVTLGQEIDMLRHYFKIIHVRYDGKADLEIDIPEKLLQLEILKLSLQPIVENAVVHGIKPKEGKGKVMITGEVENGTLEISVFDDGVGMDGKTMERINSLLSGEKMGERTADGWKNVGIKNVHDRLQMNFGESFGVDVRSHERIGTVVKIVMPVLHGSGVK